MILILSTVHNEGTGAYVMLSEYLLALTPEQRKNYAILTPYTGIVWETVQKLSIQSYKLNTSHDSLIENLKHLIAVYRTINKPKLIISWHSRSFELGVILSKLWRIPVVGVVHDHLNTPMHSFYRRKLILFSARKMNLLICVSDAVRSVWSKKVHDNLLTVIHNGLNDIDIESPRQHCVSKIRVGFLGGSSKVKGIDIIIRWIQESENLNIEWYLYGNYSEEINNRLMHFNLGNKNNIFVMGMRPREEIFSSIDILVHASDFFDPFPTVLLEAFRSGIPCVASVLGGSSEIIRDGETGFLFNPNHPLEGFDKLVSLVENSKIRELVSLNARKAFLTDFSIDKMVEKYSSVIKSVIKT